MPVTFGAFCCVLRTLFNESDYLGFYFQSKQYRRAIEQVCSGSNINNLKADNFYSLDVPFYVESERGIISAQFSSIVSQSKRIECYLASLDTLVKSRFVEMFGDPVGNDSVWPQKRIKDFCELGIGPFGSSLHKQDYIEGGHALVNPSHIVDGSIVPSANLTISDEKYAQMDSYHLEIGDVVLGRRGEIGRCAVVYEQGYLCGTGSMIVRPGANCRPDYLQRVISFPSFKVALEASAVGQTMKNLNAKIVGNAVVALPSMAFQDEFADFAARVDKLRVEAQTQKEKLQTLYDSLAQDYFAI